MLIYFLMRERNKRCGFGWVGGEVGRICEELEKKNILSEKKDLYSTKTNKKIHDISRLKNQVFFNVS